MLIVDGEAARPVDPNRSFAAKVRDVGLPNVGYYLYCRRFHRPLSTRPVDISALAEGTPTLTCTTRRKGRYSRYFEPGDVEAIRRHELDFILRFAFGIVRGEVLRVPKYGIWSFHHDDEKRYRGGPPCFWEIAHRDDVTGAMLQRITDRLDGGIVLRRGHFRTIKYSYAENLDNVYLESALWPAQVCAGIANGDTRALEAEPSRAEELAPIHRNPGNLQTARFLLTLGRNKLEHRISLWLEHDRWGIGIVDAPIEKFLDEGFQPEIQYIRHPVRSRYYADPFGIQLPDRLSILCEEYDHATERGGLCEISVRPDGTWSATPLAFPLSCHLSYPYLLQHAGHIYCVPEAQETGEIALFEAVEYPRTWRKVSVLVHGTAGVDPTIVRSHGHWWLFHTDQRRQPDGILLAHYATELEGPWKPHPLNPLKSDVRSARPAGSPFSHGGHLYRPTQNCAGTYGGSVVINRILALSPSEFAEEPAVEILPRPGAFPHGLHTLSAAGSRTLVDAKRRTFIPAALRSRLARRFRIR